MPADYSKTKENFEREVTAAICLWERTTQIATLTKWKLSKEMAQKSKMFLK